MDKDGSYNLLLGVIMPGVVFVASLIWGIIAFRKIFKHFPKSDKNDTL